MQATPPPKNDKRTIFGWAMYDWANSAYTTTTVAVLFPALLVDEIVPAGGYRLFGLLVDGEQLGSLVRGLRGDPGPRVRPLMTPYVGDRRRKRPVLRRRPQAGALDLIPPTKLPTHRWPSRGSRSSVASFALGRLERLSIDRVPPPSGCSAGVRTRRSQVAQSPLRARDEPVSQVARWSSDAPGCSRLLAIGVA